MLALLAYADDWSLHYERSGFLETGRYQEAVEYCRRLDKASPSARAIEYGKTPEGRPMVALLISSDNEFSPDRAARSKKPLIFVQNGIHSGEIEGKDASLMLARDMLIHKKHPELLNGANWVIVPVYSADAHERFSAFSRINQNGPREMGWRATGQNLNLNRDWMKADAPETRAQLRLIQRYKPDFFFDNHTTDGMDFQYVLTVDLARAPTIHRGTANWNDRMFERIKSQCEGRGIPTAPYLGAIDRTRPERGFTATDYSPRFTHGYIGVLNRPAMLVETHVLKPYRVRVDATYRVMVEAVAMCVENAAELKALNREADLALSPGDTVAVEAQLTDERTPYRFVGFEYRPIKSEITGSEVANWDRSRPITVETFVRNSFAPAQTVTLPGGYLIPSPCLEAIERLRFHGIPFKRLTAPVEGTFEGYRFTEVRLPASSFEGRQMPTYRSVPEARKRLFPVGSAVVEVSPKYARLLAHLLEPTAPDSLMRWGFFNAFLESKEYAEDYAMEPYARKMLASDPALKEEFERRLQNPEFARSPSARLRFFYERSPYYDQRLNEYPVVRLTKEQLAEVQKKSRQ